MPPRLQLTSACRSLSIRIRPSVTKCTQPRLVALRRGFADGTTPQEPTGSTLSSTSTSSSTQQPPSSPGGAAAAAAAFNSDSLLPLSMLGAGKSQAVEAKDPQADKNAAALRQLELLTQGLDPFNVAEDGHKFGLPTIVKDDGKHLRKRYQPILEQLTRLLMWDGKLSKAQRDMAMILNYLRTSPPPTINPARPLLPGSPPASQLPLDPVLYLTLAIDSVAPLIKVRNFSGLAGGGQSLPIPVPLAQRQRRRIAFMWVLDVVRKKPSRGSGRAMFPNRVAEEIVAIVEGKSHCWDRRQLLHKLGTSSRANLSHQKLSAKFGAARR